MHLIPNTIRILRRNMFFLIVPLFTIGKIRTTLVYRVYPKRLFRCRRFCIPHPKYWNTI